MKKGLFIAGVITGIAAVAGTVGVIIAKKKGVTLSSLCSCKDEKKTSVPCDCPDCCDCCDCCEEDFMETEISVEDPIEDPAEETVTKDEEIADEVVSSENVEKEVE